MEKINNFKKTCALFCALMVSACTPYLDVVPDATRSIDDVFRSQKDAIQALSNAYSYLPQVEFPDDTPWFLGDEYLSRIDYLVNPLKIPAIKLMGGQQSVSAPFLDNWSGGKNTETAYRAGKPLYQGINQCNIFLDNIDKCADMEAEDKKEWKGEVKFLKAYYHFLLLQKYGPIVISDQSIAPEETNDAVLYPNRRKIDECFDYIIALMREAIPDIRLRCTKVDYGLLDQSCAKAILARVMVTRARPFFNGNVQMYADFLDHDGQPFFPQTADPQKWTEALAAVNDAIETCTANGHQIYTFPATSNYYLYDSAEVRLAPERMQTFYSLRMMPVDAWNPEIIWGFTNLKQFSFYDNYERWGELQTAATPKTPNKAEYKTEGNFEANGNVFGSGMLLAASYRMTERYYTKNGLPIDKDKTFDASNKYTIVKTPAKTDPDYADIVGFVQPGVQTINLHLNREPRFYANLAVGGTWFRGQRYRIRANMLNKDECGKGYGQNPDLNYYSTGIGIKKWVHPESSGGWSFRTLFFPYPIIRMADLYLLKAEASNEVNGPTQEAWDALNVIRSRAGIPNVETAWGDPALCNDVDAHTDKNKLRNIILQERSIELAFEGSHFWDMRDYLRAEQEFSRPIRGWNTSGETVRSFYNLGSVENRRFTPANALWPICIDEMNTNANLIQNPGWE